VIRSPSSGDGTQYLHHCGDTHAAYQVIQDPNSGWLRSTARLKKWDAAVTVSFAGVGITLGAQSGSSQYVKVTYTFGHLYPHYYLCGNNAKPKTSARIFAGL
jgi:hypothetical protein